MNPIVLGGEDTARAFKAMVLSLGTERARRLIIEVEEAVGGASAKPLTEAELAALAGHARRT